MICLSFDIEEFDTPNLSYGKQLSWQEQVDFSAEGSAHILDILARCGLQATFFCTAKMAEAKPALIHRIVAEGHELASHTYDHGSYLTGDAQRSREILERVGKTSVCGIRFPRMQGIPAAEIRDAGYIYDSSLNPCFIPGRYTNTKAPRTPFLDNGLWIIPASVTPILRIPLFWLSFHHFPAAIYRALCRRNLRCDGQLILYFHPWEFVDLQEKVPGLPYLITHRSGAIMRRRFEQWIHIMQQKQPFGKIQDLVMLKLMPNTGENS